MSKEKTTESLLQDHLEIVSRALAQCVREAEPNPDDEYGTHRNIELGNAVMLLKASARLGFALAKLKGEFRHNIRVDRSVRASGSDQKENSVRASGSDQKENSVRASGSDQKENSVRASGSDQKENSVGEVRSDSVRTSDQTNRQGTSSQN
jgi:hypothetical protein